jgi:hypothetical protein
MTDVTLHCAICERPIGGVPPGAGGVFLCPSCAAKPVLVDAFREGRARLAGSEILAKEDVV